MAYTRRVRAWVVGTALLLAACGDPGAKPGSGGGPAAATAAGAPVPEDLARLVPADAFGVVYAPSLDRAVAKLKALVGEVDAKAAQDVDAGPLLQQIAGPAAAQVDATRAMAIVLTPGPGRDEPPAPTFLLPVRDGAAAKAAFGEVPPGKPGPIVAGSYLALSPSPSYAAVATPSPLLEGLPAGDLVVRLDLARLVAAYRPMIDEGMGSFTKRAEGGGAEVPGLAGAQAMLEGLTGAVKTFLDSAARLDLALRLDGGSAAFDVHFTAKAGSALDRPRGARGDVASLAGSLPGEYPFVVLLGGGLREMTEWATKLSDVTLSAVPEAQRSAMQGLLVATKDMAALLGDEMAVAWRLGGGGLEVVEVFGSKDPKAYVARMEEVVRSKSDAMAALGMDVESRPPTTVSGVEVHEWSWKIDLEKVMAASAQANGRNPAAEQGARSAMTGMFGSGRLRIRAAATAGQVVVVVGGADEAMAKAVEAAQAPGKPSGMLASALAAAGDRPSVVVAADLRALVTQVLEVVAKAVPEAERKPLPKVPEGGPVRLLLHGTADGREYRGSLSVDVTEGARLVKGLVEQGKEPSAAPPPGTK